MQVSCGDRTIQYTTNIHDTRSKPFIDQQTNLLKFISYYLPGAANGATGGGTTFLMGLVDFR